MPDHQQAQVPKVLAHALARLQIFHSLALLAKLQLQQSEAPQHLALHLHQPHFITLKPQSLQLHYWNQKLLLATIQFLQHLHFQLQILGLLLHQQILAQ